jgi:cyclopropane-fatty-acyl-phospholipid synthase
VTIYRSIVCAAFRRQRRGSLTVHFVDGSREVFGGLGAWPRAELRVHSDNFWRRCVLFGPIGFAESFMDGEWSTPDLVHLLDFFILNSADNPALHKPDKPGWSLFNFLNAWNQWSHRRRSNTPRMSKRNIRDHYDLSNDFFRLWLDDSLTYSSAIFPTPDADLHTAQIEKYDRLCRRLQLQPHDHLLEIGSGWGGMSIHAASTYGCKVTSLTISPAQQKEALERVQAAGLADRVEIRLQDYREVSGRFDKIVSIEMIEAVGDQFVDLFFRQCTRLLQPQGLLGLQMIICPDRQYPILREGVDFIQKHIFPGSLLMSLRRVNEAMVKAGDLNLFDWKDLGMHYARTLQLWREKFLARLEDIRALGFDEKFLRKWEYYLAYCEAAFGTRHISVVQAIYSRPNNLHLDPLPYRDEGQRLF